MDFVGSSRSQVAGGGIAGFPSKLALVGVPSVLFGAVPCPALVVWSPVPNPQSPVLGEIAMNTGKSPSAGLSCGVTLHDLGLCTVPVGILVASILTLL